MSKNYSPKVMQAHEFNIKCACNSITRNKSFRQGIHDTQQFNRASKNPRRMKYKTSTDICKQGTKKCDTKAVL